MDPEALLDHALFQLTPTRTRCDLVVVCGGKSEKLASGLVEPFVSHLKFAKDQIPKGGYSITLRPPKTDASWFTKATFLRFVRFVSTPEILERFARLEKEILQIESSFQPNESANSIVVGQAEEGSFSAANGTTKQSTTTSKLKGETDGNDDVAQEQNSKIRLQRLLETRKALLRKEQAMAYARALAAGFELDNLDDLLVFADAFGASRLREACTDFKELCKKKHSDGLWMDELAAMEAYSQPDLSFSGASGIILACEGTPLGQNNMLNFPNGNLMSNGSLDISSDSTASQSDSNKDNTVHASDQVPSKVQMQMPWPNQIPQYMFNFQNPGQQMAPYPPYPFPPMQNAPPYYPGNMHWPQNTDESRRGPTSEPDHHRHKRSSSRNKDKSRNVEGAGFSEEDEQTESADSDTGTDSEAIAYKKKEKKKSSKTVVIRNINYITSKRRNGEKDGDSDDDSSVEDGSLVDGDFLKHKVQDVVGTFEKSHNLTSSKKKRGGKKSSDFVADQEVENDPVNNMSAGGNGNGNWDSFQNLLMREKEVESQKPMDVVDEHFSVKSSVNGVMSNADALSVDFNSEKIQPRKTFGTDSFIVNDRDEANGSRVELEDFGNGETLRPGMMRRDIEQEALLFPNRVEETRSNIVGTLPFSGNDLSIIKNGKGEDWFIVNHSGDVERQTSFDGGIYNALSSVGDRSQSEVSKKIVPVDDSFMIQTQTSMGDQYDGHWKTDLSLVSGVIVPENGTPDASQKKIGVSHEPDDLSVVLSRDSGFESVGVSWSAEMDYGVEASFKEPVKKPLVETTDPDPVEEKSPTNGTSGNVKRTSSEKQTRGKGLQGSLSKSKSDVLSRSKKPLSTSRPMIQKSKLEKEEEARKKMEELAIERQKRIAERTAASGLTPAVSKKVPMASAKPRPNAAKNLVMPGQIKLRG
ncbi:COP1-interacting protein 7 [Rhododendron vialii]|uniref:COP1-interacting protein 7 n=1 Tax=Rhododendron vialii TaxID=182163 RepID=UPI00265F1564|nr:COP1-interacting protein 7 [Rhododendron vialii]